MKAIAIALIKGYRYFISPMRPPCCRFHPSCSEYAITAFQDHNFIIALFLSVKRLLKCNPFHSGGYDAVPPPTQHKSSKNTQ
ncbi:MAG: membrane protein insertion efficiency factor YidD [Pseudomonadales bacterium]|nr:membrane protein insertion efficiency factor YidD [Pseudomonadales bacterium]